MKSGDLDTFACPGGRAWFRTAKIIKRLAMRQEINKEPSKLLLRREDVLAWLNWPEQELAKCVKHGVIRTLHLRPGARALYYKSDIKTIILDE